MVRDPINSHQNETNGVAVKFRRLMHQTRPQLGLCDIDWNIRNANLEHHQRQHDGENAIGERLDARGGQPAFQSFLA